MIGPDATVETRVLSSESPCPVPPTDNDVDSTAVARDVDFSDQPATVVEQHDDPPLPAVEECDDNTATEEETVPDDLRATGVISVRHFRSPATGVVVRSCPCVDWNSCGFHSTTHCGGRCQFGGRWLCHFGGRTGKR